MKLKRIIALVLCLCMMISVQPLQAAAAEEEIIASGQEPMAWEITADGTLTISGSGAIEYTGSSYPWETYSETITKIVIGDAVTGIGANAFSYMEKLAEVELGASLQLIGDSAFRGCTALKTITLPESLVTIECAAFNGSGLTEVTIPDGVTALDINAFAYCPNLVKVQLGAAVETLASGVFEQSEKLESVDLANVRSISWECFSNTGLKSVVIPETVEWIDYRAFGFCESLTEIHFLGDAPEFSSNADSFQDVVATAYYDPTREGWTEEVMQDYGGDLTWLMEGHEHSYSAVVTPPTCTEDGYTTHTCDGCGDSYIDTVVAALGHDLTEWEVTAEATCTEAGARSRICNTCEEVFAEEIPATGHNYTDHVCTVCGYEEPALVAPVILSCYSKLQTSVKVTWELVEGADGYELWRSVTPDEEDSWKRVKTITNGETDRYTNQDLTEGVTYYYKVRAYVQDADGNKTYSEFSNVDYMPATVVWDGPYSNAINRIRLRWNEIDGAHGYQIWIGDQYSDQWYIVKTLGDKDNVLTNNQGATTAYSNTARNAGEKYTYKMRAFMIKEDGRKVFGAYSDAITVAVMPDITTITVASPKEGRVQVRWDAVSGADGYQVWMYADSSWSIIKSVTDGSTAYTKTGLTAGTEYQFRVRAYTEVDGKKTFGAYSEILSSKANGPEIVASGKCGDNLTWALDDTGTLTISGTGEMYDIDYSDHPWAERDVYKVIVESGVTSIGDYAFEVTNDDLAELTQISLPNTLKEIGYRAFARSAVTQLKIPDSVTSVDDYAFAGSALTSVTWPKGAKVVSNSAFEDCLQLKEIVIPEGITTIDYAAFRGCRNLESVSLPSTLKTLENYAFSDCDTLEAASLPDSVTTMGDSVFEWCDNLQIVYLPQNLTTIAFGTFRDCYNLQAVLLPEKLTTIEANAFSGCDALVELYFPGTEEQLAKIEVYEGNEPLQYVTVYLVTLEEE